MTSLAEIMEGDGLSHVLFHVGHGVVYVHGLGVLHVGLMYRGLTAHQACKDVEDGGFQGGCHAGPCRACGLTGQPQELLAAGQQQ